MKSGDKVLVKQQQSDKLSLPYNTSIHTVIKRDGHEAIVKSDTSGRTYRLGMAHIKKYREGDSTEAKSTENSADKKTTRVTSYENCNRQTSRVTLNENYSDENYSDENYVTRSGRLSRKPTDLTDYCLS